MLSKKINQQYLMYGSCICSFIVAILLIAAFGYWWFNKTPPASDTSGFQHLPQQNNGSNQQPPPPRQRPPPPRQQPKGIIKTPPSDIETMVGSGTPTVALFHSLRCGHSTRMTPAWEAMKESLLADSFNVEIISFEQSSDPQEIQQQKIGGFPTIRYYSDGFPSENFSDYKGDRSKESLIRFITSGGKNM